MAVILSRSASVARLIMIPSSAICASDNLRPLCEIFAFWPMLSLFHYGLGRRLVHIERCDPKASIFQRPIDHPDEIADGALVQAKFCIIVGVRPGGYDLVLALAGSLQLCNALACVDEHLPILTDHRLGAERGVSGYDLGVVLGKRQNLVDAADHAVDTAAIGKINVGIAAEHD